MFNAYQRTKQYVDSGNICNVLILSKIETFSRTHESKIHQYLPHYLWHICAIEGHRYCKYKYFVKVKDKDNAQGS